MHLKRFIVPHANGGVVGKSGQAFSLPASSSSVGMAEMKNTRGPRSSTLRLERRVCSWPCQPQRELLILAPISSPAEALRLEEL